MKKVLIALSFMVMVGLSALAQTTNVTGTVTDANDGTPIPGVSVFVKGTTIGTVTMPDGKYSLAVPNDAPALVFSFVGMTTQEVVYTGQTTINAVMQSDAVDVGEVVVTGYGVTKKAAFTGAAATLGEDKIVDKSNANPIRALEGSVAGLQMNTGTGQPGAPATIYIRGRNSINSGTQPLYVIDGVPMEAGTWGARSSEGQEFSPLSSLNASDIESMTVLKDATATSIYGARAANGVIVITTKKGQAGSKTKVTLEVKRGIEQMPIYTDDYKVVNAEKYNELQVEGWANYLGTDLETASDYYYNDYLWGYSLPDQGITPDNMADQNWMDAITRTGNVEEYNIGIQTAGKETSSPKAYFSFGYLNNEAYIKGKDFQRYSFRFNIDQKPNNWIAYGINTSLAYTETNMGAGGGYFSDPITQAMMQSPLTPVYDENGDYNFNTVNGYNPVAQRSEFGDKSENRTYRAIVSPFVKVNFLPELAFTSRVGLDFMYMNEFGYWSFLQPQGNDMRGMGENSTNDQTMLTITNTLNYLKTYNGVHNINLLLGQETTQTNQNNTYLSASNYPVPDKNVVSLAATPGSASTDKYQLRLASFFFNGQYDYSGKYYLSASYRYDGSSRFGTENKWAGFWSVGAKYRLTAESFMEGSSSWLDNLTLRASYGTSGNQSVGGNWYASRALWGYGYNYNSNGGSAPEQYGNKDLKWEETAKFNVGLDATLLSIFNVTLDYYHHTTQDMVFNVPMSLTSGFSSIPQNVGELENKGYEMSIGANIIRKADFNWNVTLVGSHNENTVTKLSTDLPIEAAYTIIEPGKDIFQFKMKEFAGVDPENGNPLYYLNETGEETTDNYNAAAKRYVGAASPDFQGSFSNALNFKGIDFSFQLNYSLGAKIYGSHLRYDEQRGGGLNQAMTNYVYDNRWQKAGDITDVPRFEMTARNSHSSQFLMDGDYLKIQNIVLGYTLPSDWVERIKLSKVRVYFSASNVYTFAKDGYRGYDPAGVDPNGIQWWNYPTPSTYLFGLNVNF